jgi:hypothetical protein
MMYKSHSFTDSFLACGVFLAVLRPTQGGRCVSDYVQKTLRVDFGKTAGYCA